jgi:hypothetical protein
MKKLGIEEELSDEQLAEAYRSRYNELRAKQPPDIEEARKIVSKDLLDAKYLKNETAKLYCLFLALEIWDAEVKNGETITRIGKVIDTISGELKKEKMFCPTTTTIKRWLKDFEKRYMLIIPPEAKTPGAPTKK